MHKLIDKRELLSKNSGFGRRMVVGAAMHSLKVNKINALYDSLYLSGDDFTAQAISRLGVRVEVSSLANIPTKGAAIIIANHPTGMLDGIILTDIITKVRGDIKFMGNFLLNRIEPLKKYFIDVDPFNAPNRAMNHRGVKLSLEHLQNGGVLVVFPAGEVSTWQNGFRSVRDKQWSSSMIKFIRRAEVPVIPINIAASNSFLFHLGGKIHPVVRTAFLGRELMNKKGKTIRVKMGTAIRPQILPSELSLEQYSNFLRANVDFMFPEKKKHRQRWREHNENRQIEDIALQVESGYILDELAAIEDCKLFSSGSYDLYFSAPQNIPYIVKEIGRLREITFRSIGEGTMTKADNDSYDSYYHQLFIWDSAEKAIVGAYRMGMGREISQKFGTKGFYTNTLFRLDNNMLPIMECSIEMGRSFVVEKYQRKVMPLMLLWKGIFSVLLLNKEYKYLLGAVSVSGDFSAASKKLIINYLKRHHLDKALVSNISPVYGAKGIYSTINTSLVDDIADVELISKLISDIEGDNKSVPILIVKYLSLGSTVLGFNVDPNFNYALDALIILDVDQVPQTMVNVLSK